MLSSNPGNGLLTSRLNLGLETADRSHQVEPATGRGSSDIYSAEGSHVHETMRETHVGQS